MLRNRLCDQWRRPPGSLLAGFGALHRGCNVLTMGGVPAILQAEPVRDRGASQILISTKLQDFLIDG